MVTKLKLAIKLAVHGQYRLPNLTFFFLDLVSNFKCYAYTTRHFIHDFSVISCGGQFFIFTYQLQQNCLL